MFILVEDQEFYVGKTYILQGECFPATVSINYAHTAKRYNTKARAEIACKKLNIKVGWNFKVSEICSN